MLEELLLEIMIDGDRMVVHEVGAVQETTLSVMNTLVNKIMGGMRPVQVSMETTEKCLTVLGEGSIIVHHIMYWYWCPANKYIQCICLMIEYT